MTHAYLPGITPPHLAAHLLLRPGQPVHVNHHAGWLPATVTRIAARTVEVSYPATTAAGRLARTVRPWAVRPADGARLRPARQVTAGDQIIFGSRIRTVAAPPAQDQAGWLVLAFTDGGQAALVLPGAVLRLLDDTPPVSVHGRPVTTRSGRPGHA
ncbi:hypothetical protein [Mangrovihabitans endophyticus]|uniref:Uncharacterized protein n=1 Tax=Mangrovihabitans endophyticus TaxID=1751298 RepID=A0A8J3FRW3_9ACTN|nr:hypothetical protein [Mangrovihabitans endophyticus]GGL12678.1 hypothetical protein GCM10012284_54230 [Mangrovihabitans endophyticus]